MICGKVQEHMVINLGQIDLKWFEEHVKICLDCKATMGVLEEVMSESLNEDDEGVNI